jgi:hypothetical protein
MTMKPKDGLPEWIGEYENYQDQIVKIQEALSIAIQAFEAIQFGSLEANFRQCTQTHQEIAKEALERIAALGEK